MNNSKFYISGFNKFDGEFGAFPDVWLQHVNKKAKLEAEWIDSHVRKLLPDWVVKASPYLYKFYFFKLIIRNFSRITISHLYDPFKGLRVVTIYKKGEKKFIKKFHD